MDIGIYGDSFGYEDLLFDQYHPNIQNIESSWVTYLRKYYKITNYCKPASDLFYTYKNFLENYKKYDKNVILITNSGRLSFKFQDSFIHSHNMLSAMGKLKIEKNTEKKKAIQAAVDYFQFIQDDEKDLEINKLLTKEIMCKDPNALIIDCFGSNGLVNVTKLEDTTWNLKQTYTSLDKTLDLRYSHMTRKNNLILCSLVKQCIDRNSKFQFNIKDFIPPTQEEKSLYIVDKLR